MTAQVFTGADFGSQPTQSLTQLGGVVVGHVLVGAGQGLAKDGGVPGSGGGGFTLDLFTTGLTHSVSLGASQTLTKATSATAGAKTVNITTTAASTPGVIFVLKTTLADGTAYTITPHAGDTIDGAASYTFEDNAKDAVWLVSDGGTNLMVV